MLSCAWTLFYLLAKYLSRVPRRPIILTSVLHPPQKKTNQQFSLFCSVPPIQPKLPTLTGQQYVSTNKDVYIIFSGNFQIEV